MVQNKKIAVVASRLKCVDAISIEADKWIDRYESMGHSVHLIAGKFGEPVQQHHFSIPEMDYKHAEVRGVKRIVFGAQLDKEGQKAAHILLNNLVKRIKGPLKNYLVQNKIQLISIEDALISMKNLPLNIALSQIVKELGIPTISRIHYLPWDNPYFTKNDNIPKLMEAIPIKAKNVVHITNTTNTQERLKEKTKAESKVIPNTIDLAKLHILDDYNKDFKEKFGIKKDQLIFLQPTRVKRSKAIEKSIKLVSEINNSTKKDHVLMLTGSPVYSRQNYFEEIVKKAKRNNVNIIFANDRVFLGRHRNTEQKFYSINDAYVHADVVIYPNMGEAFGNPVIEATAYKKPLVVNEYPHLREIQEKGFNFVVMDQKVTPETVSDTCEVLMDSSKRDSMTCSNFELLKKHYSSDVLTTNLTQIMEELDNQPSFISRMASSIFPTNIFGGKKENEKRTNSKNRPSAKTNTHKREKFKTSKSKNNRNKGKDLKNKKGGYKEPVKKN